jgi:hypothetical protein
MHLLGVSVTIICATSVYTIIPSLVDVVDRCKQD